MRSCLSDLKFSMASAHTSKSGSVKLMRISCHKIAAQMYGLWLNKKAAQKHGSNVKTKKAPAGA